MEKLFPSASVVSQHLQGDMSLTQIFKKYSDAIDELGSVKYERDILKVQINGLKIEVRLKN